MKYNYYLCKIIYTFVNNQKRNIMKKLITYSILVLCLFLSAISAQSQTYWNGGVDKSWTGTGTADDPILISTAEQLAGFADSVNSGDDFSGRYIELAADIYLSDSTLGDSLKHEWEHPIGQFQSGGQGWEYTLDTAWFRGNFDGKNHTIYNLFHGTTPETPDWNNPDNPFGDMDVIDFSGWDKALFGFVENATIKNVRLENAVVTGASKIATLALEVRGNSLIENCHATGYVNAVADVGGYAGGLITYLTSGEVINCSANVTTLAMRYVGGLIGLVSSDGVVRDCSASGAAHCVEYDAGGLVGTNSGLIENSHASGRVSRAYYSNAYYDCGGFVGDNSGVIRNCSAKGDVHIYGQNGGGFAGWNKGHIESSYCLGDVHDETDGYGGSASAFCGMNGRDATGEVYPTNVPGTLINCFATGKTDVRDKLNLTGYPAGRPSRGFLDSYGVNAVKIINCSYLQVRPDTLMGILGGVQELQESYMKSQAFVDELNMFAALYGISTWEYRAGDYPVPTGVKATNITDYLAGGAGTKEDPFLIETKQHLENFRDMVNHGEHFEGKYIRQTADIALNAPRAQWGIQMPEQWTAIGTMKFVTCYEPHYMVERSHTYHFRGTYDGDFHKIENMYIDDPAGRPAGLFGILYHNAVIKNLSVTDAYVISPGTHAGVAILASDVDRYANNVYISQCHTSGTVGDPDNVYWLIAASAIVNGIALEGDNWILNCSSSADVYAAEQPSAVTHQGGIGGTDTIGNFLFTGTLTKRCNMSYCALRVPDDQDSWIVSQNGYFDSDVLKVFKDERDYNNLGRPTAYLQSEDFANLLNDYVDNWNATHTYKLDYWQPQEGDYPRVNPNYKPALTVTFESNGGSVIATKNVSENTHVLMPEKPTKEGYIFAGWYTDAAFTQVFDFDSTAVTQSMTLYAKWLEPTYDDYDYSIFNNKFATEFHITNKAQLIGFMHAVNGIDGVLTPNNFKGKTVYLDCDILLNDTADWQYWGKYTYAESWTPIGTGSYYMDPVHPFLGTFDGQGHVISGLYIDGNEDTIRELEEHGLFGYVGTKGETTVIRNLGIQASVADMRGNLIHSNMGLLVGVLRDGTISQCFTHGKIIVNAKSNEDIGGFAGQLGGINYDAGGAITDCYARVDIIYNPMDINATVRGLFGSGLVDWNNGSISNSYVAGGSWQEGVAGGTISNVYFNKELSPNTGANTGVGMITPEMHSKITFAGFDFDSIWGRNDTINDGYPYLRCFHKEFIPDSPDEMTIVSGIELLEADSIINVVAGDTVQLHVSVLPYDADEKGITWSYRGYGGLSIDENGLVITKHLRNYANRYTQEVVTATTVQGNYQKKCTLNVYHPSYTTITYSKHRYIGTTEWTQWESAESYTKSVNWEYQVGFWTTPDSLHQAVTFTNSNPEVASFEIISQDTIDDQKRRISLGVLKCLTAGTTTIQFIHPNGFTSSQQFTVAFNNVNRLDIVAPSTTLKIGDTMQLQATIIPVYASEPPKGLSWSSSDENILKVDANGQVVAVGVGTATVTLTSANPALTATKQITVEHVRLSRLEIQSSDDDATIFMGDTCTLYAVFSPANTTMRDVEWSTDTTYFKIIPMGDSCKVVGLKETGSRRRSIKVKSLNDSWYSAEYILYVNKKVAVTGIQLTKSEYALLKGDVDKTLVANLSPSNASNKNVIWSSADTTIVSVRTEEGHTDIAYLSALRVGKTTITATTQDGGFSASCLVTVTSNDFFTITFLNEDATVLQTVQVREGEMPQYTGTTPIKAATVEHIYTFAGWSPEFVPVLENATYTATYTESKRKYTIQFLNYNGSLLQSSQVEYGVMPEYIGTTPVRPSSAQYNYMFDTWTPEIAIVTKDANYTASFTSFIRQYTVTFLDWDGTQLSEQVVDYGSAAVAPTDPTRDGYTFTGWDKDFTNVQSDLTVTAQYQQNIVYYTVTFLDWDGTELYVEQVEEGKDAIGPTSNPTRDGYTFIGWSKPITNITSDLTVIAQYQQNIVYYTVTFLDWDGTELYVEQVEEGKDAIGPTSNPTRDGYTFIGWSKPITNITSDLTVIAQYEQNKIYYTVTFLDWDGTELYVEQVEEGKDAVGPAINPTRDGYTFIGWSKPITNITSNLTVIAQYKQDENTALDDIEEESALHPRKEMIDGILYIIMPDGTKYTMQGKRVK